MKGHILTRAAHKGGLHWVCRMLKQSRLRHSDSTAVGGPKSSMLPRHTFTHRSAVCVACRKPTRFFTATAIADPQPVVIRIQQPARISWCSILLLRGRKWTTAGAIYFYPVLRSFRTRKFKQCPSVHRQRTPPVSKLRCRGTRSNELCSLSDKSRKDANNAIMKRNEK